MDQFLSIPLTELSSSKKVVINLDPTSIIKILLYDIMLSYFFFVFLVQFPIVS